MITSAQLRAARALLGIDQRELAELCGLSVPTIQRMETSDGVIRCNVDSLMKLRSALGGAGASLYAIGYGQHEPELGRRVLPFFATFLAGMNLGVVAADAFTFLVAWEFMSLSSWGLVVSRHLEHENVRAGFVYLVMASF